MTSYHKLFRCKWLADGSKSLTEMAERLEATAKELREMDATGVRLDGIVEDDYAELITENKDSVIKFGLENLDDEESEEDDGDDQEGHS